MAIIDMSIGSACLQEVAAPVIVNAQPKKEQVIEASPKPEPSGDATLVGVTPDEFTLLDSLYQSYLRFLKASKDQAQAAKDLAAAQTAFDACQGETKGAKEAFEVILRSLPDELVKIRDPQAQAMIDSVRELQHSEKMPETANQALPECARQAINASESYEVWRSLPTQKIVDSGVAGLGKKKAELLVEKFPTIGDLEATRADASNKGIHWSKMLPKGFGRDVSDAIFDAMSKLLKDLETSKVGVGSSESVSREEIDGSDEPSLAVDPEPSPPEVNDIDPDDELQYEDFDSNDGVNFKIDEVELPFDEHGSVDDDGISDITALDWIESLYNEITEDTGEQKKLWGLNQSGKNPTEWEKGRKSQEDGFEIADCPYGRDREQAARDWLRGWIAASMNMDL